MPRITAKEHKHKFELITDKSGCPVCHYEVVVAIAKCECGAQMGPTQMEQRLNATECLNNIDEHFDLESLAWGVRSNYGPKDPGYKLANALIEYAETLKDIDAE